MDEEPSASGAPVETEYVPSNACTGLNSVGAFQPGKLLGKGGYGRVVDGRHPVTGKRVAIKETLSQRDECRGIHISAIREVMTFKELQRRPHSNIVTVHDIGFRDAAVCMVFEYCTTDLEIVLNDSSIQLSQPIVKAYMQMMLSAVAHLHGMGIIHQDIKPNNFLVSEDGSLKLTDFGMAGFVPPPDREMQPQVVTIWYRAPELLFGADQHGPPVDVWALGCIFAQLLRRKPLLMGDGSFEILAQISQRLGVPSEETWPGVSSLRGFHASSRTDPPEGLENQVPRSTPSNAIDLLQRMLTLDPARRITAEEALRHPYFSSYPPPAGPGTLPTRATEDEESGSGPTSGVKGGAMKSEGPDGEEETPRTDLDSVRAKLF